LDGFTYKFKKGERIGIVGANGTGKSTFLKVLTQQLPPDGGKIVVGDTIVLDIIPRMVLIVNEDKMVIDVIRDIAEYIPLDKGFKLSAESLLENFFSQTTAKGFGIAAEWWRKTKAYTCLPS
jgi:ATP-binding cassette subfamily F protein uup